MWKIQNNQLQLVWVSDSKWQLMNTYKKNIQSGKKFMSFSGIYEQGNHLVKNWNHRPQDNWASNQENEVTDTQL